MSDTPLLSLSQVRFTYPGCAAPVLDGVDFALHPGERLGLFGPNGCGKTTLLSVMMGILPPDQGEVLHNGRPARSEDDFLRLRKDVGFLLQYADDQILFPTVLDDVAFGPLNLGLSPAEAHSRALETLSFLCMDGFEDRLTHKLSGGQKKLVTLAGVLAMRPKALLLDEPTGSLDPATRDHLAKILTQLEVATLVVSHDWDFLHQTSHSFCTIASGRLHLCTEAKLHHHFHVHPLGDHPEHSHERIPGT